MSHSNVFGILVVLEFMLRKTVDVLSVFDLFDKYEKSHIIPSDNQLVLGCQAQRGDHFHNFSHIIHHPDQLYQGLRCFVTSSALSRAEIEL